MKPDFQARVFRRKGNSLVPADQYADEMMAGIKEGKDVLIRLWKPRNIKQHKLVFALAQIVYENSELFKSQEHVIRELKHETGLTDVYVGFDGVRRYEVRSISFGSMPQDEFERWLPRALYVLSYFSGIPESVLLEEGKKNG